MILDPGHIQDCDIKFRLNPILPFSCLMSEPQQDQEGNTVALDNWMVGEGFNTWSLILRSCAQPHPRIQGNLQNTGIVLKTKGLCCLVPGRTCQTAVYIQSRPPCHCSTYHKMKDARKKGSLPSLTSRYLLRRKSVFCGHPFSLLSCTPSRLPLD